MEPKLAKLLRELESKPVWCYKASAIESDNLDERIVTISCKRVHGATRARPVKRLFVRG